MRTLFLLLVCLAAATAVAGPGADLPGLLTGLDPAGIPSGILYDRALIMSELPLHDGSAGAPPVAAGPWRQMAHEMSLASLDKAAWPDAAQVRALVRAEVDAGRVPLGLLDLRYQRLREDALESGALALQDGALAPGPAKDAALYEDGRVFAAAALAPRTYRGSDVRFVLPRALLVANGADPAVLSADFADGRGWRPVVPGAEIAVRYRLEGRKLLRLRADYPDGERLESSFVFQVSALVTPAPSATWSLTASIPWNGAAATGEAYVYLAPGHAVVTEPVVVVEGFDLDNSMGWDELYALLNAENMIEDLRAAGFDAVVLNFTESTEPIQRNAMLLVELLQQVHAAQPDGRDLAVIGASMGGLVSRYALAWMEQQGLPHRARAYMSFDTPHGGANIPLGVQFWLELFQIESADAGYLLSRLDTPAARQMLLYHHAAPSGSTTLRDPLRDAFLTDLAAVGDYPALPRKTAVANGSGAGQDQGYAAGAQLISYEYYSFLVDIIGNVWAVPDGGSRQILEGLIDRIWPLPNDGLNVYVEGTRPWDSAPGGTRASLAEMDAVPAPYGDIVALHPEHCFIPTISALALPTDDPFFDIAGQADLASLSPFDVVHVPAANQPHVAVTPENKVWIAAALEREASAVDPLPDAAAGALALSARPNPFNPRTEIRYELPAAGPAVVDVYDVRGHRVRALVAGAHAAGRHVAVWDGRDDGGRALPSGAYVARVRTPGGIATARLTLVR
jgi:hypothetical protein